MAVRPISYVKAHPAATVITFAAGAMAGQWLLGMIGSKTGVSVSLPSFGSNGG